MVTLNYRDARPIYSQIVEGFREQIAAGILGPGERLPSVRELAAALTINPNTIQRAYRELEASGWVETLPGKGCFVRSIAVPQEQAALLQRFDDAVAALLQQGVSREELMARLREGGKNDA